MQQWSRPWSLEYMPEREFSDSIDWSGTTHPNCRQQHSVGWNPGLSEKEKVNNSGFDGSLLPACRYDVTSRLLLSCFPCHNLMDGTLKLQAQIKPFLPKLLLWYFIKALWTVTDYIVENTSSQLHIAVLIDVTPQKVMRKQELLWRKVNARTTLFSPCFYW